MNIKERLGALVGKLPLIDLIFATVMVAAVVVLGVWAAGAALLEEGVLLPGSSVNGIDVSGMDPNAAAERVIGVEEKRMLAAFSLTIVGDGRETVYSAGDLQVRTDARAAIDGALGRLSRGVFFPRIAAYYQVRDGMTVELSYLYDEAVVRAICRAYAAQRYAAPQDALIRLHGGAVEFVPEQDGRLVDVAALYTAVSQQLAGQEARVRVDFPSEAEPARVLIGELEATTTELSRCETELEAEDIEACERLAARLNGRVLPAEQDTSFRSLLYESGMVPPGGNELAGQVAGTFYNAALLAGADKVFRKANEAPTDYLPMGLDARLDNETDLILRNGTRFPLYILAEVKDDALCIRVHGRIGPLEETLRIGSEVEREIEPGEPEEEADPSLPAGRRDLVREARVGYRVSSYRERVRDGVVVERELLSVDTYPARATLYRVGE